MRDQYAGDISDFFKYHFIVSVVGARKLGVAWFYVPSHDGRNDGKHIEWRTDEQFKLCDPQLAEHLSILSERTVCAVEQADFWPI